MRNLSPELALVDPELAEAARRRPSAPAYAIARLPKPYASARPFEWPLSLERPSAWALFKIAMAVPALLAFAASMAALAPSPHSADGRLTEPVIASKSSPSTAARASTTSAVASSPASSQARSPVRIEWAARSGADLYNVVLVKDDKRTDLWQRETAVTLRDLTSEALAPGTHEWFVYPGYREEGRFRYGALLAYGTVRIPKG
jgi:hypothetical protein